MSRLAEIATRKALSLEMVFIVSRCAAPAIPFFHIFVCWQAEIITFCESWLDDRDAAARAAAAAVAVDLARFVPRLVAEHPAEFPDARAAAKAAREYRRFLTLKRDAPDAVLAPPPRVDRVWHAHILDTRRYHADCARLFGGYLHHDPAFDGAAAASAEEEDEEEEAADGVVAGGALRAAYAATLRRYREAFLVDAPADVWPRLGGTGGGGGGEHALGARLGGGGALRCLVPTCCG